MPPALQLLRSLLAGDSDSDSDGDDEEGKKEGEDDDDKSKEAESSDVNNAESSESTENKSSPEESVSASEGSKSTENKESEARHPLFGRRNKPSRKPGGLCLFSTYMCTITHIHPCTYTY